MAPRPATSGQLSRICMALDGAIVTIGMARPQLRGAATAKALSRRVHMGILHVPLHLPTLIRLTSATLRIINVGVSQGAMAGTAILDGCAAIPGQWLPASRGLLVGLPDEGL